MDREVLKINPEEWIPKGQGGQATTYEHISNPDILLKLYLPIYSIEYVANELDLNEKIRALGIHTPEVYSLATDGTRNGAIFRRIQNKKSFCQIVSEHPEQTEEMARRMAREAKRLHSIPVQDRTSFIDSREYLKRLIGNATGLSEKHRKKAEALISKLPTGKCYCHGDFQFGNIITDGKEDWFIDMGSFCIGTPEFDMANLFHVCYMSRETVLKDMFHINRKQADRFWNSFICEYYGRRLSRRECYKLIEIPFVIYMFWSFGIFGLPPVRTFLKTRQLWLLKYLIGPANRVPR